MDGTVAWHEIEGLLEIWTKIAATTVTELVRLTCSAADWVSVPIVRGPAPKYRTQIGEISFALGSL